ncbi:MAG TPA: M14 family zinc carboxypeptidase, partial [Longimicrobiales bacterium]|nr:M14 family zinc carboxypeptidase [Longimicrobiales bacterium]
MRVSLPFLLLLGACSVAPPAPPVPAPEAAAGGPTPGVSTPQLATLQRRYRVDGLDRRDFTHAQLWTAIGPIIDAAPGLERQVVGRSGLGRPIFAVRYGRGPTRVLLWSQMHGNESTATMALADIFRFLALAPDDPLARRLADRLTVLFVPMLNPDGAQRFQRWNAQGVDINRDARSLATPEARTLRNLQV